ncbi:methionine ABC transporter ATP-binding protein [Shouchella shacheensis]|uniref:methionine ABC transporter ATP-binding protein n=1 Tax=Shouchella shacheensis TaxID=1649580 RepID=UPI00073FB208|nr:methionine ABC transporter ATP-binding protein [Shouchella shacheensis]
MITLSDIRKVFQTKSGEVTAVDRVNLTIEDGQIFGVIGYSGAGKSTLIRMLNMLERPTKGDVVVAGKSLSTLSNQELRKARQEIGMIFQHFHLLWSRTVEDNIAFPLEIAGMAAGERKKRVAELIELVGLNGREKSYPSQLSGGQKQRVGIARALANNPKVLLCDEATSALDPKTTDAILDLLLDINQKLGLTIVLITHEMHVIQKICHQVAVMDDGHVVEQGAVLDVFRHPKQEMTREFVKQVALPDDGEDSLWHWFEDEARGTIAQLTFVGKPAEEQLVSELIRAYPVDVSILQGNISKLQDGSYGKLFLRITGEDEDVERALSYIAEQQVEVEVMERD